MTKSSYDLMLQGVSPEVRLLQIGGRARDELLRDLNSAGIKLNQHAKTLLTSEKFQTSEAPRRIRVIVISARDLGFPCSTGIQAIRKSAFERKLSLCPVELAPHFRLQYLDQPEGFIGHPATQQQAPAGSITVASEPLDLDDNFPKGFYLRRIKGELWLRGYCSHNEHLWNPDDRFCFCVT